MTLGTHAVVASAIQYGFSLTSIPAFIIGFISHFVLDMIPHRDYPILSSFCHPLEANGVSEKKKIFLDFVRMGTDCGLGLLISFLFFSHGGTDFTFFYAAIGSVVPDALQFAYKLFPRLLNRLQIFHSNLQNHVDISTGTGITVQACVAVVSILSSLFFV